VQWHKTKREAEADAMAAATPGKVYGIVQWHKREAEAEAEAEADAAASPAKVYGIVQWHK
jgi:hypothetical protein